MREDRRREKLKAVLDRLEKKQQAAVYNDSYTKNRAFYKLLVLFRKDEIAQALQRLVNYSRITISKSVYIFRRLAEEESVKHELKLTTFASFFEGKCFESKQQIFRSIAFMKFRFPVNLLIRRLMLKARYSVGVLRAANRRENLVRLLRLTRKTFDKKAVLKYAAFSEIKLRAMLVKSKMGSGLEKLRHFMEKNELIKKSRMLSNVKSKEVLRQKTSSLCYFLHRKVEEKTKIALAQIRSFSILKTANQKQAARSLQELLSRKILQRESAAFLVLKGPEPAVLEPLFQLLGDMLRARKTAAFSRVLSFSFRRTALLLKLETRVRAKQTQAFARLRRCRQVRAAAAQKQREGLVRLSRIIEPNFFREYRQLRSPSSKKGRQPATKLPLTAHQSPLYFPFRILAKTADKKLKATRLLYLVKEAVAVRKSSVVSQMKKWVQLKAACARLGRLVAVHALPRKAPLFGFFHSIAQSQLRAADRIASVLCSLMMKKQAEGYHCIRLFDLRVDVPAIVARAVGALEACFGRRKRQGMGALVAESKAQTYRACYSVIWDKLWAERLQSKLEGKKAALKGRLDRLLSRSKLPACLLRLVRCKKEDHFGLIRQAGKTKVLKKVESLVRRAERAWRRVSVQLLKVSLGTAASRLRQKPAKQAQFSSPSRLLYFARLNKTVNSLLLDRYKQAFNRMLTILRGEVQDQNSYGTLSTRLSTIDDTIDRLTRKKLVRIQLDKKEYGSSYYHG